MTRVLASLIALSGIVVTASPAMATDAPAAAQPAKAHYTTSDTPLGDLLDNAAAKAILQKEIPDIVNNDGIEMARGMTLKQLQNYAGDKLTDEKLAAIDAQFAKLAGS